MTIALIPDNDMKNEINIVQNDKFSGADMFLDYVQHGGKALIRQKRRVTRAVRPTKR